MDQRKLATVELATSNVINALKQDKVYSAIKYLSPTFVVRATRKRFGKKLPAKNQNFEATLVIGRPNYEQREFIKLCKKAGEPFPVKMVQLKLTK